MSADDDTLDEMGSWLCECNDVNCRAVIELELDEMLLARAGRRDRYVIVPGHEAPEDEVLEVREGYLVVQA